MSASRDNEIPSGGATMEAQQRRLDLAILGFNRHAIRAERHRLLIQRFKDSREVFASSLASHAAVIAEARRGADEREKWRAARAGADLHRESIRVCVGAFVRVLRNDGMAPERALVLVKHRLVHCVSAEAPNAPAFDARTLESEVSAWAIAAYFEAA